MRYWCGSEGKKVLSSNLLKRQSDFNWYAEIPLLSQWEHRQLTVIVEALFNNGEVRRYRRSFFYEKPERKQLPLRLSWIKNVGASIFMSAPLVYRKRLFTASVDDNESGKAAVVCMDAVLKVYRKGHRRDPVAFCNYFLQNTCFSKKIVL